MTQGIKIGYIPILLFAVLLATICVIFTPPLGVFAVIFLLFALFMYAKFPKTTMLLLGIFLIFQDLIIFQFEQNPLLTTMLKRIEEAIILMAFLMLILRKAFRGEKWEKTGIDIPLACLIGIGILGSAINRIVPFRLAAFDLFLLIKGFLVFYIFYNLKLSPENIRKAARIFFGIMTGIFLLGMVDLAFPEAFRGFIHNRVFIDYRFGIPSVQSIFVHPGAFGWFMAFIASYCFAFFIIARKTGYLVFSILFSLGAVLSMRFKPVAGLLAAIFTAFIFISGTKKAKMVIVLILLILIFGSFFGAKMGLLFEDRVYRYLQYQNISDEARNALYAASVRVAGDFFPLGSGLGTFGGWIAALYYSPLYNQYGLSTVYGLEKGGRFLTDTFWPYLIAQFGVIGILCYAWILIVFFHNAASVFKKAENLFIKAFALGTLMILAEGLVESLAEAVFVGPPQFFFIFAAMGVTFSLQKKKTFTENHIR